MDDLLQILKASAEPTRLRLLALCARAELTVSDLTQILGQSQPRVSRHLKLLCDCGLLDRSREGTFAFFRLSEKGRATTLAHILVDAIPKNDATLALDLERLDTIRRSRADAALAYFRDNAERWHEIRALHVPEREVEAALAALFPESVEDMVDIGTGTGRMLEILGPRCRHAVGVDLSREMLSIARAKLEAAGLRQCHVRQADIYQLPFPAASFDAAVVHQVLHFAEDPAGVVAEAARVLRPGGRLLMVDFAPHELEALRTDHAHRRLGFADGEVEQWCRQAGLTMAAPVHLPGDPLTVSLWTAERPAASPLFPASTVTGATS